MPVIASGIPVNITFCTADQDGNDTAADALPTGSMIVDGEDVAGDVTITDKTGGRYKANCTVPTSAVNQFFELKVNAVIGGVSQTDIVFRGIVSPAVTLIDNAINQQKIADGSLQAAKFADGFLTAAKIAADAITAAKIAADAFTVAKFADGAITGPKLDATALAAIKAQLVAAINVDTYAEPAQGAPAATTTVIGRLGFLYKLARNKITQTATVQSVFNDDGVTVDHKATVANDGTTFTRGEMAGGP